MMANALFILFIVYELCETTMNNNSFRDPFKPLIHKKNNKQTKQNKKNGPIQFACCPIQHLHTVLVWKAPVHTGLLGLPGVTRGVVHAHPANLQATRGVQEEKEERKCQIKIGKKKTKKERKLS